ncbi:MAG TPA: OB-fold domain-containing protein [Pseudonocardia sp.]|jgi:hypothetical protein
MSAPLSTAAVAGLRALGSPTAEHLVPIAPHLAGAAAARIVLPWCAGCAQAHWYPALRCPGCGGGDWTWRDVGTDAVLDSWTIVHHALAPALREHVPFALGLAVPVGAPNVRLVATLLVLPGQTPRIGQPLTARPGPELDDGRLLSFATGATS